MSSTFSANEPALGYYYQIIRGLVQLLYENRMANPCLSFECLDDIAIEEAGNEESGDVELYQAKLHITPAQMTDRSTDFWKTIRVWSEGIQDGTFNPAVTIFTLITTASISEDSFLKLFFSDKEENRKKILTTMETIAAETTNKSNKPGYEAFSKLTEDQKQGLIVNWSECVWSYIDIEDRVDLYYVTVENLDQFTKSPVIDSVSFVYDVETEGLFEE